MTTKHTPGPWTVSNGPQVWFHGRGALDSPRICTLQNAATPVAQIDLETIAANARLIAAAPELLAALQSLLLQTEAAAIAGTYNIALVESLHHARAALSKAGA